MRHTGWDELEVLVRHAIEVRTGPVRASHKATAALNLQLATPGLRFTPYRAPLDVRRVGGGLAGDWTPLVFGDQARLEQLETVEEARGSDPGSVANATVPTRSMRLRSM